MVEAEFQIKPEKGAASVDTSSWPLLLKVRLIQCNFLVTIYLWKAIIASYMGWERVYVYSWLDGAF